MKRLHFSAVLILLLGVLAASAGRTQQVTFSEDFTGTSSANSWYFFSGACLTAGTSTSTANPGPIPSCNSVLSSYYTNAANADPYLVGGNSGFLGSGTAPGSISAHGGDPG